MFQAGRGRLARVGYGSRLLDAIFSLTLLAALAVMMLPRQFQVAVVENSSEHHLRRAVWMFPLYLLLINVFVIPIALAGQLEFAGSKKNNIVSHSMRAIARKLSNAATSPTCFSARASGRAATRSSSRA